MKAPRVTLFKRENSPFYYVNFRDREGKRHRISTGSTHQSTAKKWAKTLETKLLAEFLGLHTPQQAVDVTLGEVMDTYRRRLVPGRVKPYTAKRQRERVAYVETCFGGRERPASEISTAVVDQFISDQLTAGKSLSTAYSYVTDLKAGFRQATKDGLLQKIPFEIANGTFKRRKVYRGKVIPDEHVDAILSNLDCSRSVDRCILLLAVTGMRRSDLLGNEVNGTAPLDWSQIDLEKGIVRPFQTSKTGVEVAPPLPGWALDLLRPHSEASGPIVGGMHHRDIAKRTKELCGAEYRFHIWRATYVTKLAKSGINPKTIAKLVGHSNPQITLGYTQIDKRLQKEAVDQVWAQSGPTGKGKTP